MSSRREAGWEEWIESVRSGGVVSLTPCGLNNGPTRSGPFFCHFYRFLIFFSFSLSHNRNFLPILRPGSKGYSLHTRASGSTGKKGNSLFSNLLFFGNDKTSFLSSQMSSLCTSAPGAYFSKNHKTSLFVVCLCGILALPGSAWEKGCIFQDSIYNVL